MWIVNKVQNQFCSRSNIEEDASKIITINIDQKPFQSTQRLVRKDQSELINKSDKINEYPQYIDNETQQQQLAQDQNRTIHESEQNIKNPNAYNEKYNNRSTIEKQEHYQLDQPTIKESSNIIQILKEDSNIQQQNSGIRQSPEIRQNSDIKSQDQYKDNLFSSIAITSQSICDGCGVLITTTMKITNCRHVYHEKCYHQMLVEQINFKKKPRVYCFCSQEIKLFKNSLIEAELFEQLMRNQLDILKFRVNLIFQCQKCNFFAFCETSKCIDCDKLFECE